MIVSFRLKKKHGTITVVQGRAKVEFADDQTRAILEEQVNQYQTIVFKSINSDGTPRENTSNAVPACDDGMLVYFLKSGVPGIRGRIQIVDVQGSDRVAFRK